jgi:STE24 endopeptidase
VLWRTQVPSDLRLPDVAIGDYFSGQELDRARRFERFLRVEFALSTLVLLAVLLAYAARGTRLMRESAAGRIGTGMLLGMLGLALVWLAQLPFTVVELWWSRRYGLSRVGYVDAILGNWLALGAEFLFLSLALVIVMGLAGPLRQRWWLAGAPVFVALAALFAFVFPYLIADTRPLRDPALVADARAFARAQGMEPVPVEVEEVHELTTAPNAEAAGLGPSRHVFLWDTLLDGRFPNSEVRVVLAHELAHLSRDHIWKLLGWYALFAVPGAYLIAAATRRRGGMAEAAAVPLSLLVLVVLQLAAQPFQNVITRRFEAEADWVALQTTRDPEAARGLFRRFTKTALVQPDPPTWAYLLLDTHPTIAQRIAMANAWDARSK